MSYCFGEVDVRGKGGGRRGRLWCILVSVMRGKRRGVMEYLRGFLI